MNELIRQAITTRRFKWGLIGTLVSALFLVLSIVFHEDAALQVDEREKDSRFETAAWEKLSVDEQQRLSRELMVVKNNLGQIRMGKVLFAITLTISLILFITAFVRIKSKLDEFIEEDNRNDR